MKTKLEQAYDFQTQLTQLINSTKLDGVTIFYILQNLSLQLNNQLMELQLIQINQENQEEREKFEQELKEKSLKINNIGQE